MTLATDRILKGLCPQCGKEAAPYRLCYDCRQMIRLTRALKRGAKIGTLKTIGLGNRRISKNTLWALGPKVDDPIARKESNKWATPFILPDSDRRGQPKLRGIRVDVERTIYSVMQHIGRPCTIDEILAAWGKLRAKRSDPLAGDLARIIAATDKRQRRAAKRAALMEGQS